MDLKQLDQFITIVNEGNISKAARVLHMSQPPLSTQIHSLEAELGCKLFIRGSRSIQLTEAGKMLYNRSNTLLKIADITKSELKDYSTGTHGTIRIGAVSSVGTTLLDQWVAGFHKQYSHLRFELFEANTYGLLEQLKSNIIELAIVRTPFNKESFSCRNLYSEPMMAVGDRKYFNQTQSSIELSDLACCPLIIYRRWETILNGLFQKADLKPDYFCVNDDAKTSISWADKGLGVAIVPASCLSLIHNPACISKKIEESELESTICIISNHSEQGYLSTGAKLFTQFIEEDIKSNHF